MVYRVVINKDSTVDQLRPIIPLSSGLNTAKSDDLYLLWMRGDYTSFLNMNTEVVFEKNPKAIE